MPRIKHHRSSRRVPPPKDSDFDHEIGLVDHSVSGTESQTEDGDSLRPSSRAPHSDAGPSRQDQPAEVNNGTVRVCRDTHTNDAKGSDAALARPSRPSVQVEGMLYIIRKSVVLLRDLACANSKT